MLTSVVMRAYLCYLRVLPAAWLQRVVWDGRKCQRCPLKVVVDRLVLEIFSFGSSMGVDPLEFRSPLKYNMNKILCKEDRYLPYRANHNSLVVQPGASSAASMAQQKLSSISSQVAVEKSKSGPAHENSTATKKASWHTLQAESAMQVSLPASQIVAVVVELAVTLRGLTAFGQLLGEIPHRESAQSQY